MPKNKSATARYFAIDECLRNKLRKYPNIYELAEACSRRVGKEVSRSTVEKDLSDMRKSEALGFYAPIVYSPQHRGYAYGEVGYSISDLPLDEEEWEALAYAANLLHQYREVPLFRAFQQAIDKIHARFTIPFDHNDPDFEAMVQFETGNATNGYHWLASIYNAMRERLRLRISYENIYKQETKSYELQPCLLKEQRNRWYVIGWVQQRNDYLTFPLDRIHELETLPGRQPLRTDFKSAHMLQHAVGIMEGDGTAVAVELELFPPANRLVLLEPLHPSQQVLKQTNRSAHVSLQVNLNPELYQRILSLGPACKVKKPAVLKQALKEQLEQTLQHYR